MDMMDMASPSQWADERRASSDLVLVTRPGAFGLPTACPACLPAFLYLRLAAISFQKQVTATEPDSEDLPAVEYGESVGFASDDGGVVAFLRREKVADLDVGLSESEKAELETCKAMMESWVADASLYETWMRENERQCKVVYFAELPWGLAQALDWKQRVGVMQRLGVTPDNAASRAEEMYRKAGSAYAALSVLLSDQRFFFSNHGPTSLDAIVLGHLLFHLHVPFEVSTLKGEIVKYQNLVDYAETWNRQLLGDGGEDDIDFAFKPKAPPPPPPPRSKANEKPAKAMSEKDIVFKKRAKYFVVAQVAAVLMYALFAGFGVDDEDGDDNGEDDE